MRGKKTSEEDKEKLKAVVLLNPNASQRDIAKQVNMPLTTVHQLYNEIKDTDEFEQARTIKKQEFINKAWELVKKSLNKIEEKLESLTPEQLQKTNIRDIAITMGTIYDKQALASGEPTIISERQEPTPELVKELEEKVKKLKEMTGA
jgi:hypothetical protein